MRLLLVENDANTANILAKGFGESGFVVDVAVNGLAGRHFVEEQNARHVAARGNRGLACTGVVVRGEHLRHVRA